MQPLSTRSRLIVTSILLCLALGATVFCAVQTVRAIQRFEQARSLATQGDVNAIEPWMTIHYISHAYSVPESYLIARINISDSRPVSHVPLRTLAVRYNRSVDGIIKEIQIAIKAYRKGYTYHLSFSYMHVNVLLALKRRVT